MVICTATNVIPKQACGLKKIIYYIHNLQHAHQLIKINTICFYSKKLTKPVKKAGFGDTFTNYLPTNNLLQNIAKYITNVPLEMQLTNI